MKKRLKLMTILCSPIYVDVSEKQPHELTNTDRGLKL